MTGTASSRENDLVSRGNELPSRENEIIIKEQYNIKKVVLWKKSSAIKKYRVIKKRFIIAMSRERLTNSWERVERISYVVETT